MPRPPPRPTLFPYTTLFRSRREFGRRHLEPAVRSPPGPVTASGISSPATVEETEGIVRRPHGPAVMAVVRSEEHTSELQSRGHLVCRLLLEKKNKQHKTESQ